ncbi:LGFP repeat-containing protein [Corynebacterium nasicanis]|uniref:LGFP repeat-containing protein n=1 Tax=Corynebacterium nasicanis TaxID=1448267 RepID=A0ABW1QDS8_9CORY
MPAVATAQAERTIAPEDIDAYIKEFHQDPITPPVVDGVGGVTDAELAAYHDLVRATQAAGDPEPELVPGQMWSDTVGLPAGVDKTDADAAEIAIATEQDTLPGIDTLETLDTLDALDARMMAPTSTHCKTFLFSPHQVCGAILARYEALGGQFGWLMHPIEPMHLNPDGQGYRQRFHNGFIYWHPNTGAHAVTVRNADVWARNGWEQGWLGYPLGGEVPVMGTAPADGELNGWVQLFQGGRMYRTPLAQGPQVASINGAMLDKWLELGGTDSTLGFPIADEAKTADGVGRFSIFQGGSIYWHPNTGAHSVQGEILDQWRSAGSESGHFGYPVAEPEIEDGTTFGTQSFQHGSIRGNVDSPEEHFSVSTPYLHFPTLDEALEYFSEFEGVLRSTDPISASRQIESRPTSGKQYGPCTLYPSVFHARTKSGRAESIGFKPYTECEVPVSSINHKSRIMHKKLSVYEELYQAPKSSNTGQARLETKNIQFFCNGQTPNIFKGSTIGTINYNGKDYYASVWTFTTRQNCGIK